MITHPWFNFGGGLADIKARLIWSFNAELQQLMPNQRLSHSRLVPDIFIWSLRKRLFRRIIFARLIGLFFFYRPGVVCRNHIPPHLIISLGRIKRGPCKCHYAMHSLHRKWYCLYRYMHVHVHRIPSCIKCALVCITKQKLVSNSSMYSIRREWEIFITMTS